MKNLLLKLLIFMTLFGCKQTVDLELDSSIIPLIDSYLSEFKRDNLRNSPDSIDLYVYQHPFQSFILIQESSPILSDVPLFCTNIGTVKVRIFTSARQVFKNKAQFYSGTQNSLYENQFEIDKNEATIFDPIYHFYALEGNKYNRCEIWDCLHKNLPPRPKVTIKYEPPN